MLNADTTLCSASFCDDATLMATGYSDSKIRVHSLTKQDLRSMKCASDLAEIDPEADDIFDRIMDQGGASKEKVRVTLNVTYISVVIVSSRCYMPHMPALFSAQVSPQIKDFS